MEPVLKELSPVFEEMYAVIGRPSIPPEHLLKATLLMTLYSVRSGRQFCERLDYGEHFSVDGTLLEAWAALRSFRPRDDKEPPAGGGRNPERDFRGQPRKNETHISRTDPEARLYTKSKGQAAKLSYMAHTLLENRSGLLLDILVTEATGTAERESAITLLKRRRGVHRRATVGADKAYDTKDFVKQCREQDVTPHVAQNTTKRRSAIDGRVTRHEGYVLSQRKRKRIEEGFGWMKTVGAARKLRYIGVLKNQFWMTMEAITYNLIRMANLAASDP